MILSNEYFYLYSYLAWVNVLVLLMQPGYSAIVFVLCCWYMIHHCHDYYKIWLREYENTRIQARRIIEVGPVLRVNYVLESIKLLGHQNDPTDFN